MDRRYSADMGPPGRDRAPMAMGRDRDMGRDYRDRERGRDDMGMGRDRDMRDRERDMGPPMGMGMGMGMGRDMGPPPRERDLGGPMPGGYAGVPRSFGRAPIGPGMVGRPRDYGPPPGMRGPPAMAGPPQPEFVVDREKTCPLLLRVWTNKGSHRRLEDYAVRGKEPAGDIQVYTWMDANLRELSDLIKEVNPDARARSSRLSFALVYPDKQGRNVMRQLGVVHSSRQSEDDLRTLKSLKFQTGDFMDVAVMAGF